MRQGFTPKAMGQKPYFRPSLNQTKVNPEQLISRYVYQHGEISLQGLGTIKLTESLPDADFLQKHKDLPVSGLEYTYKPSVTTTPEFIKFYAEQRGKIQSLADSDIQAYLQMAVQLLNIGNPFEIRGLGSLSKQNDGRLIFTPGHYISPRDNEEAPANRFRERQNVEDNRTILNRQPDEQEANKGKLLKVLGGVIGAVLVLAAGWWIYATFVSPKNTAPATEADTAIAADTITQTTQVAPDTSALTAAPAAPVVDSVSAFNWKAYFRTETGKEKALAVMQNYSKIKSQVYMETVDSNNYSYYVLVSGSLRDTARITDSLKRFFARPVSLSKQ